MVPFSPRSSSILAVIASSSLEEISLPFLQRMTTSFFSVIIRQNRNYLLLYFKPFGFFALNKQLLRNTPKWLGAHTSCV